MKTNRAKPGTWPAAGVPWVVPGAMRLVPAFAARADAQVSAGATGERLNPETSKAGLTWGHDQNLANSALRFDLRIDEVLYKGGTFVPVQAEALDLWLGHSLDNPPLGASDHAAVTAGFRLK